MSKIAAIVSSPRSPAHAGMAAEALRRTAEVHGHTITIEVQNDGNGQQALGAGALANADVVLLAADTKLDTARFRGKPVYSVRTSDAIRNTMDVLDGALALVGTGARSNGTDGHTNGAPARLNAPTVRTNDTNTPTASAVRVYNNEPQAERRDDVVRVYDAVTQPAPVTQPMPATTVPQAGNGAARVGTSPVVTTTYGNAPAAPTVATAPVPDMQDIGADAGAPSAPPPKQVLSTSSAKRLVGITSCPTGIAHTFMAAQALEKAARALGHEIKVETQGSVGAKNQLTDDDIANADAVVIAADTKVNTDRFAGKPIYMTGTKEAMRQGQQVIQTALEQGRGETPMATTAGAAAGAASAGAATGTAARGGSYTDTVARAKADRSAQRTGPYKHLMTGVSYMLPIIVAGGLSLALAFAFGGIPQPGQEYPEGSLAWAFTLIGGRAAFGVYVGVLSAFIAYSIADRPGIAPGLIGGLLASQIGAGFLGGILSGFLAGYVVKFLADNLRLPSVLSGLMPVLILPFVGTVVVGLAMVYLIGEPVAAALSALTAWLQSLGTGNAVLLGLILGAMMAFDMGGPVNKAAYAFSLGLLGSQINEPIAAVMAAGMTPPLGLALASALFRNRFDDEEREAAGPAVVLGLAFITEGAIPFAAKDPFRVIPSLMLGSAVAAALSMYFDIGLRAPHGGVFVLPIPNAVTNLGLYALAILAGTVVTAIALLILKRPLTKTAAARGVDDTATVTA